MAKTDETKNTDVPQIDETRRQELLVKYNALMNEKKTKEEALDILGSEYGYSRHTVSELMQEQASDATGQRSPT